MAAMIRKSAPSAASSKVAIKRSAPASRTVVRAQAEAGESKMAFLASAAAALLMTTSVVDVQPVMASTVSTYQVADNILDQISGAINQVSGDAKGAKNDAAGEVNSALQGPKTAANKLGSGDFKGAAERVAGDAEGAKNSVGDAAKGLFNQVSGDSKGTGSQVTGDIKGAKNEATGAFKGLFNQVSGDAKGAKNDAAGEVNSALQGPKTAANRLASGDFKGAADRVAGDAEGAKNSIADVAKGLFNQGGLNNSNVGGTVKGAANDAADKISNAGQQLKNGPTFGQAKVDAGNALKEGVRSL